MLTLNLKRHAFPKKDAFVCGQPRPQGAFPWLPPPKPGKSALGEEVGLWALI